ncbi:MAG: hypothetical protein ACJAT3_001842 [Akkermansiaceae bacterium]|jgi:hypothetical protein
MAVLFQVPLPVELSRRWIKVGKEALVTLAVTRTASLEVGTAGL